jgi:hypothetical protein
MTMIYWAQTFILQRKTGALVVARKETSLEINADKTRYMVMTRDQNAGQSHNVKTDNSSFESVEEIRHFATKLTNQNSISGRN